MGWARLHQCQGPRTSPWRSLATNLSKFLYTEYVKVEAHTEDNTYTANGNREVDTLAQDRSDRFKMQHFTVVTPAEWQEAGGAIVVPEGEEWNLLTKVHSHLGHVGARRVEIFLDGITLGQNLP